MKTAALLIVLLSNQGYWFGGAEGEVVLRWTLEAPMPEAVFEWELMADKVRLAGGQANLPAGKEPAPIRLTPPEVRVRTAVRLVYRLKSAADQAEIAKGEAAIDLFPRDLLAGVEQRARGKSILVLDGPQGLPRVLADHKIPHTAIETVGKLPLTRPDVILVGVDQLTDAPLEQSRLLGQAEAGASVMIFRQAKVRTLAGYPLADRRTSGGAAAGGAAGAAAMPLERRTTHALLLGFEERDLRRLVERADSVRAVALPADEPALELIFWPREAPGRQPVPIDALLVTKSVGKGRVVFCQLPLGDWKADPRSRLFLANALDYLLTRPEPTPRPSERIEHPPPQPTTVPSILIPSGATP